MFSGVPENVANSFVHPSHKATMKKLIISLTWLIKIIKLIKVYLKRQQNRK